MYRQLILLRNSDCLGCAVLVCLVVCLTLLASFFLPSASLINMYVLYTADLEVRVKTEAGFQRHSFKFSLGKLQQSLPSINWTPLTTSETTYQHIRIHELRADDSLSYFMATLSSIPAARAMILVNHSRSYELSAKFQSEEQCSPVPMLLVTQETGRELLRLVGDHQREVEARVGVSGSSRPLSLELEKRESRK